jgi:hypothetical protein
MMFFVGMHQPSDAGRVRGAFISIHRLKKRRSTFPARRFIIDSGGFQSIRLHGGYPLNPWFYAQQVKRWKGLMGKKLLAAVSQDYMCEPAMILKTGLSIPEHQRLTIQRYDDLMACDLGGAYLMPVLQGYEPKDYVAHLKMYDERLKRRAWVGVGTLCKRQINMGDIEDILMAVKLYRPDLRLHGFGIKTTALESEIVRDLLFSADSMAWSWHARMHGRDGNSAAEAARFADKISAMPVQLSMLASWGEKQLAAAGVRANDARRLIVMRQERRHLAGLVSLRDAGTDMLPDRPPVRQDDVGHKLILKHGDPGGDRL